MAPRIDFSLLKSLARSVRRRRFYPMGPREAMVEMHYGGMLSFDTRNIDTMPGPVRDGWAEPWNDLLLRSLLKPGMTYVNCGANYGYFTVLGGLQVGVQGKVFSFEANPHIFCHLMRSLFYSGTVVQTTLFNRAVSNTDGEQLDFLFDPQYSGGGNVTWARPEPKAAEDYATPDDCTWSPATLPRLLDDRGRWINGRGLVSGFPATTITLDTALEGLADTIDVIQLDIEGSEPRAILGAKKVLAASPDVRIIMEWFGKYAERPGVAETCREMWDFLVTEQKFQPFRIEPAPSMPYTTPPTLHKVESWEAFCALPHGEVYLERG